MRDLINQNITGIKRFVKTIIEYLLFSYIEEIVWNCKFVFRYNRVNKLGKTFLYKFDIGNEEVEVLNKVN